MSNAQPPQPDYEPPVAKTPVVQEPVATPPQQYQQPTQQATPPPQPVQAAAPPQPVPQAAPAMQRAAPPPNSRRLSMNVLAGIDEAATTAAANMNSAPKVLTEERAHELFEAYKKKLQAEDKTVIYAQFIMMKLEVRPPDEVCIISPTNLIDMYAKEQRTALIDFFREETKMIVRIKMEVHEDETLLAEIKKNAVLSKSEVFEVMANKNPNLAVLKDGLGMQIEY